MRDHPLAVLTTVVSLVGLLAAPASASASASAPAAAGRPLQLDDFLKIGWVTQAAPSPDGRWVAFRVSRHDLTTNKARRDLWLADTTGGQVRQLTSHEADDSEPTWEPDSSAVIFVSKRGAQTEPQLWRVPVDGGEATPLPEVCTGVGGPLVSPDGAMIAFTADVFPDCADVACTCARNEALSKPHASGQLYDSLLYRHWNAWRDAHRTHVLVLERASGKARDLTPGPADAPPIALGGARDYDFSPKGDQLAYVSNLDPVVATSTNNDVFIVSTRAAAKVGTDTKASANSKPRRISTGGGNDYNPRFSLDGHLLAFFSMERPGFEADRPRLMVVDLQSGATRQLAAELDRTLDELAWASDSKGLYLTADDRARRPIYYVPLTTGVAQPILTGASFSELQVSPDSRATVASHETTKAFTSDRLTFRRETLAAPPEIFTARADGSSLTRLSHVNDVLLAGIDLPVSQEVWFTGAKGEQVQALLLLPPQATASTKSLPLVLLLHGGPQGSFDETFHPRWNAEMFAAAGYAIGMINFHGSIGYGQAFSDAVSRDWGGAPYEDVMKGLDALLAKDKRLDKSRVCAAGASYGGYMINWIAGHTDRFRCLISHAGLYNLTSEYGATEELWFPQWELGGTPWDNPELYERWSPHRFTAAFKTPTLVIQGANDFRVPLEQGLGMFTALQRRGVPSKLLVFPDEDHFVQKPLNAQLWWQTMLDWLHTHLK